MPLPRSLHDLISRQWGAVALRQGSVSGVSPRTMRKIADDEGWDDPHPGFGVRIHPASTDTFERRVTAALLAVGDHALASRWTAAHLHGLTSRTPNRLEIVVPYGRGVWPRSSGVSGGQADDGSRVHPARCCRRYARS